MLIKITGGRVYDPTQNLDGGKEGMARKRYPTEQIIRR